MIQQDVQLKHELTDKEVADLARQQSIALQERNSLEDELASVKKMYASKQAEADAKVTGIAVRISTGFEMRNIRCLFVDERPEGYRLVIRLDNGHIASRRVLDSHERQMKLTTEPPRPLSFSCILPVDDKNWETDFFEVALYDDEVNAMKDIPNLTWKPIERKRALIEDGGKGSKKK